MDTSEVWEERVNHFHKELVFQGLNGKRRWDIHAAVKFFNLPASKLRYWQDEFGFDVDRSTEKKIRYYDFKNMRLIIEIIRLIEVEGFTIRGAKRQLINSLIFRRQVNVKL